MCVCDLFRRYVQKLQNYFSTNLRYSTSANLRYSTNKNKHKIKLHTNNQNIFM